MHDFWCYILLDIIQIKLIFPPHEYFVDYQETRKLMVKVTISVLVAEDHHVVRAGLCGLLEAPTDIAVVGEAENGREAVKLALELKPQVVLLDIGMPQLNGIDAARQIVADSPDTKIICLSMHREKHLVQAMLQAGANGYLLKTCAAKDLVEAIRAVAFGRAYLSSDIAGDIVSDHVRNNDNNQTCSSTFHHLLRYLVLMMMRVILNYSQRIQYSGGRAYCGAAGGGPEDGPGV